MNEVVTDKGTIQTEIVVNASGQWGREIGKMVGLNLPVVPMAHLYLITKPISGVTTRLPHTCAIRISWSTGARKSVASSRAAMSAIPHRSVWTASRATSSTSCCPPIGIASLR